MTRTPWLAAALLALASGPALAQSAPASAPAARVLTTATLVELCGAAPATGEAPATAFCRGFIIGAGQYHHAIRQGSTRPPMFCLPDPGPSYEQFQTAFVTWARANPGPAEERAVDGLTRFVIAAYPCPPAQAASRNRAR
jgi:hypothetical protein